MMQKFLYTIAVLALVLSCKYGKSSDERILLDSTGNINEVSVVIDNTLWNGSVGEAIRNVLAAPLYGLPQDEPLFNINQIPSHVFSGFITKNRTVLKIEKGPSARITFQDNIYAKPQRVVTISGQSHQELIGLLNKNASKIIEAFKSMEIAHKQQVFKKSLFKTDVFKEKLGINISFPSAYRIAKDDNNFFWIRRDINTGTLNLLIYEMPLSAIKRNDSVITQIIKIRDSIGKKYIEGPVEGSYMATENAYTPFNTENILDNKPAMETRGMWDVTNAVMAGPFINYAIEDKINNRWIILEGFAFAPSVEKRDYMFELEAIIKTVNIL